MSELEITYIKIKEGLPELRWRVHGMVGPEKSSVPGKETPVSSFFTAWDRMAVHLKWMVEKGLSVDLPASLIGPTSVTVTHKEDRRITVKICGAFSTPISNSPINVGLPVIHEPEDDMFNDVNLKVLFTDVRSLMDEAVKYLDGEFDADNSEPLPFGDEGTTVTVADADVDDETGEPEDPEIIEDAADASGDDTESATHEHEGQASLDASDPALLSGGHAFNAGRSAALDGKPGTVPDDYTGAASDIWRRGYEAGVQERDDAEGNADDSDADSNITPLRAAQ